MVPISLRINIRVPTTPCRICAHGLFDPIPSYSPPSSLRCSPSGFSLKTVDRLPPDSFCTDCSLSPECSSPRQLQSSLSDHFNIFVQISSFQWQVTQPLHLKVQPLSKALPTRLSLLIFHSAYHFLTYDFLIYYAFGLSLSFHQHVAFAGIGIRVGSIRGYALRTQNGTWHRKVLDKYLSSG